jgi:hypothetical protein
VDHTARGRCGGAGGDNTTLGVLVAVRVGAVVGRGRGGDLTGDTQPTPWR